MQIVENINLTEWAREMNNCADLFKNVVGVVSDKGEKLYNVTLDGTICAGKDNNPPSAEDRAIINGLLGVG